MYLEGSMNGMQKKISDDRVLYVCSAYASGGMMKTPGHNGRIQKYERLSSEVTPVTFDPCATLFTIASGAHGESRPLGLNRATDMRCRTLRN